MKKLIICALAIFMASVCTAAENGPLKGSFEGSINDEYYVCADIDLYERSINGAPALYWDDEAMKYVSNDDDETVKVYGVIEAYSPRFIDIYYIINVDSIGSPEPNIWIFSDKWSSNGYPVRVACDYNPTDKSITLNDWDGGNIFSNIKLFKK